MPFTPDGSALDMPWAQAKELAAHCRRFLKSQADRSYDFHSNGERRLLERLAEFQPQVIFDVGANVGDWSLMAHAACPGALIHAFEIVEQTYSSLKARTLASEGWLIAQRFGLAAERGSLTVNCFEGRDELATYTNFPHGAATQVKGDVETGDAYLASAGVTHVDFLKLDVEGAEPLVLKGFERAFASAAIDVVQFEYGQTSILTRFLLADFHSFFETHGFLVGKLSPEGVDFRPYALDDEDFVGPNFVACRRDLKDRIAALRSFEA